MRTKNGRVFVEVDDKIGGDICFVIICEYSIVCCPEKRKKKNSIVRLIIIWQRVFTPGHLLTYKMFQRMAV